VLCRVADVDVELRGIPPGIRCTGSTAVAFSTGPVGFPRTDARTGAGGAVRFAHRRHAFGPRSCCYGPELSDDRHLEAWIWIAHEGHIRGIGCDANLGWKVDSTGAIVACGWVSVLRYTPLIDVRVITVLDADAAVLVVAGPDLRVSAVVSGSVLYPEIDESFWRGPWTGDCVDIAAASPLTISLAGVTSAG